MRDFDEILTPAEDKEGRVVFAEGWVGLSESPYAVIAPECLLIKYLAEESMIFPPAPPNWLLWFRLGIPCEYYEVPYWTRPGMWDKMARAMVKKWSWLGDF